MNVMPKLIIGVTLLSAMAFSVTALSVHRAFLISKQRVGVATSRLYSSTKRTYKKRRDGAEFGKSSTDLSWENYEFGENPKIDNRFGASKHEMASGVMICAKEEAKQDIKAAEELNSSQDAFMSLSPDVVKSACDVLEPWINEDRLQKVTRVLKQRTKRSKFLFENPSNPSNVWACLRTIDSFGVQNVDCIIDSGMYAGKQAIHQKKGMRTAMGSAQWLSLKNHLSTADAIKEIKNQGYKIYATDLNSNSKDVRDLDWDTSPICVVMGNEERGISQEMRDAADETFILPMCGFAESFNLSVATSITLAHMSAKSFGENGPLRKGDLDEHEYNCLYLKGLLNSLPQKRTGKLLLKQNNIIIPDRALSFI